VSGEKSALEFDERRHGRLRISWDEVQVSAEHGRLMSSFRPLGLQRRQYRAHGPTSPRGPTSGCNNIIALTIVLKFKTCTVSICCISEIRIGGFIISFVQIRRRSSNDDNKTEYNCHTVIMLSFGHATWSKTLKLLSGFAAFYQTSMFENTYIFTIFFRLKNMTFLK